MATHSDFKRGRKDLHKLLKAGRLTGPPWAGDAVEREWVHYISNSVIEKQQNMTKPGYQLFPENWLAIYDNVPGPRQKLIEATEMLTAALQSHLLASPKFSQISVESGDSMVLITEKGTTVMSLADLW